MTPERWKRIRTALEAVAEVSAERREAVLVRACGEDPALIAEARSILAADSPTRDSLSPFAATSMSELTTLNELGTGRSVAVGRSVGDYLLLEEIAQGGMGVVYRAQQLGLNRQVALKMILAGEQASATEVRRFRTEAEAVATLDHPHIVPIYEVGEHEGLQYYSMKLVEGRNLSQYLREGVPDPAVSAKLLATLAHAIAYAHKRGILHRDLKPGNVLVDAGGVPYVTDFGLARRLGVDSTLSASGVIVGTPAYMAPEQAAGLSREVTVAADIYSLGAVLYELLTGRAPFSGASALGVLHDVVTRPPQSPRAFSRSVPRDLELICLKCLEKEPADRYASADAFADDLERWLRHEPIAAGTRSVSTRLIRWIRRRPTVAALAGVAVGAFLTGGGGILWQWRRAEESLVAARANLYLSHIALAQREWTVGHVRLAQQLLEECPWNLRDWEWHYLKRLCVARALTFKSTQGTIAPYRRSDATVGAVRDVALSADGRRVAWIESDGTAVVADIPAASRVAVETYRCDHARHVRLSMDGSRLLCSGGQALSGSISLWDIGARRESLRWSGPGGPFSGAVFSPDGNYVAAGMFFQDIGLWNANTGQAVRTLAGNQRGIQAVAFSADGTSLVSVSENGHWALWDVNRGKQRWFIDTGAGLATDLRMSADGRRMATSHSNGLIRVWNPDTGEKLVQLASSTGAVLAVSFAPDGQRLASAGEDGLVRIWDLAVGRELFSLRGHNDAVTGVDFSADGQRLASSSRDGTVLLWTEVAPQEAVVVSNPGATVTSLAFSPDGRRLAAGFPLHMGTRVAARVWNVVTGAEIFATTGEDFPGPVELVAFTPDGKELLSVNAYEGFRWPLDGRQKLGMALGIGGAGAVSIDGRYVATDSSREHTISIRSSATGRELQELPAAIPPLTATVGVFSRDRRYFAQGGTDGSAHVWDLDTSAEIHSFRGNGTKVASLVFSPDDTVLAAAGENGTIRCLSLEARHREQTLYGHGLAVTSVAFSPDGGRLASGSKDKTVRVWDVANAREVLKLDGHEEEVTTVVFSPDGTHLASGAGDGKVRIWDATPVSRVAAPNGNRRE